MEARQCLRICGLSCCRSIGPAHGRVCWRGGGTSSQKGSALLPPYTTGIVRIRSKAGRVIGGWQCQAADRRCASRCGRSSRSASGFGVAFVVSADSQGVDPRSLNWKISSPGEARDRNPRLSLQWLDRRRGGSSGSGPCWRRRLRGCLILGRRWSGAELTFACGSALLTTCDAAGLARRT